MNDQATIDSLQTSIQLAYEALRAVLSDRLYGCLCDECLRNILAERGRDNSEWEVPKWQPDVRVTRRDLEACEDEGACDAGAI